MFLPCCTDFSASVSMANSPWASLPLTVPHKCLKSMIWWMPLREPKEKMQEVILSGTRWQCSLPSPLLLPYSGHLFTWDHPGLNVATLAHPCMAGNASNTCMFCRAFSRLWSLSEYPCGVGIRKRWCGICTGWGVGSSCEPTASPSKMQEKAVACRYGSRCPELASPKTLSRVSTL